MLDGKTFPKLSCTHDVLPMYDGAILTKSGHFLGMRPTKK
jgi:hypothetical protein